MTVRPVLAVLLSLTSLLRGANEHSGTLSGRVVEADTNSPVEGATVSLAINAQTIAAVSAKTDHDGYYSFENLPVGHGNLSVTKTGFGSITSFTEPEQAGVEILVLHNQTKNFAITRSSSLVLRLYDADTHLPITGLKVTPLRVDFGVGVKRYIPVFDAGLSQPSPGTTIVSGLPGGDYLIEIADPHDISTAVGDPRMAKDGPAANAQHAQDSSSFGYGKSYYPNSPDLGGASPITITAGATQRLDGWIRKQHLLKVSGTASVVGSADSAMIIELEKEGPGMYEALAHIQLSGADSFQIMGVPPGHYRLMAWSEAAAKSETTYDERELEIVDKDIPQLRLDLQKGSTLRGTVIYPDNTGFIPAFISLRPAFRLTIGPSLGMSLSADGTFTFEDVLRGIYTYNLSGLPGGLLIAKATYGDRDVTYSTLSVDASSNLSELRILTTNTFCVSSGIVTQDGKPVPNVSVLILPDPLPDDLDALKVIQVTSDATGSFSARLPFGDYRAAAISQEEAQGVRDVQMIRNNFPLGVKFDAHSFAAQINVQR